MQPDNNHSDDVDALKERLLRIQKLARIGIWQWNVGTGEVILSDQAATLLGTPPSKPNGGLQALLETVLHPSESGKARQENEIFFKDRVFVPREYRIVTSNGPVHWVRFDGECLFDAAGALKTVLGTLQDITEHKKTEEALRQSESFFKEVLALLPVGVHLTDKDGNIVQSNDAGKKIWEGTRYVGIDHYGEYKGWWLATGEPIEPQDWAAARAILKGEISINEEIEIQCFDGTRKFILNSAIPVWDNERTIVGAIIVNQDITEFKDMARELQEQAKTLEAFFKHTDDPIVFLTPGFDFIRVNEAYARACHRDISTFPGHNHFEYYPNAENEAIFRKVVETKTSYTAHAKVFVFPDHPEWGMTYWDWALIPILSIKGEVAFLVFTLRDVTQVKTDAQKLIAAATYSRSLIEATLDPMFTINVAGEITGVNAAAERVTGIERGRLMGQDLSRYFTNPDAEKAGATQAFKIGSVHDLPLSIQHSLGKVTNVLYNATTFQSSAGDVDGVLVVARDITELEQAFQRNKEQAELLELASDAIIEVDLAGKILYWNRGAERLYGWDAKTLIGKELPEFLLTKKQELAEIKQNCLSFGKWTGELSSVNTEGTLLIVNSRWTLMMDVAGKPRSILMINTDITERKSLESQLLRIQRLESIGTLASGLAHDLNNILTPILLTIDMVRNKLDDPADKQLVRRLEGNVDRASKIIRHLLTFARGMEGVREPMDVTRIILETEKTARETFPRSIDVRSEISPETWLVKGDGTQIHQIIMNLIINSKDAMPDGGVLIISAKNFLVDDSFSRMNLESKVGPHVLITVKDTGTGMANDVLNRLFEPFFTTKKRGEGTGLGLSTVRAIVKGHGGFITVSSELGKGTTFSVYLPADPDSVPIQVTSGQDVGPAGSGELVLVVDDEEMIRDVTARSLEQNGYRVLLAGDGAEAVAIFVQHRSEIKVVVLDIMMPIMDGQACARAIRKIDPNIKIIVVSGLGTDPRKISAESSTDAFLSKPYTTRKLLETVHHVVVSKSLL